MAFKLKTIIKKVAKMQQVPTPTTKTQRQMMATKGKKPVIKAC